jgi:hypothetical protein
LASAFASQAQDINQAKRLSMQSKVKSILKSIIKAKPSNAAFFTLGMYTLLKV